jgi:hypothetical protein
VANATDVHHLPLLDFLVRIYTGSYKMKQNVIVEAIPEASLRPEITDKIIDQISIINGYIEIVLLKYPGDTFLNECLSEISNSADKVTEQLLLDVGYRPTKIKH